MASDGMTDTRSNSEYALSSKQAQEMQHACKARFRNRLLEMSCMADMTVSDVNQIASDMAMDVWHVASNLSK